MIGPYPASDVGRLKIPTPMMLPTMSAVAVVSPKPRAPAGSGLSSAASSSPLARPLTVIVSPTGHADPRAGAVIGTNGGLQPVTGHRQGGNRKPLANAGAQQLFTRARNAPDHGSSGNGFRELRDEGLRRRVQARSSLLARMECSTAGVIDTLCVDHARDPLGNVERSIVASAAFVRLTLNQMRSRVPSKHPESYRQTPDGFRPIRRPKSHMPYPRQGESRVVLGLGGFSSVVPSRSWSIR